MDNKDKQVDDMSTIESRLNALMNSKGFVRKVDFAKFLGITTQNLNQWYVRAVPNTEILQEKFPNISPDWIMNGVGPMIKSEYSMYDENGIAYIESRKEAHMIPPELVTENTISVDTFAEEHSDRLKAYEPSQLMPPFDLIFRMHQNNMSPSIEKGDILFLKKMRSPEDVVDGEPYFVDTKNLSKVVYYLSATSDRCGFVCNSASPSFPPVTIYNENIYSIYSIVGMFSYDVRRNADVRSLLAMIDEKDEMIRMLNNQVSQLIAQGSSQNSITENLVSIMRTMQSQPSK